MEDRLTVPVKPLRLDIVRATDSEVPRRTGKDVGFAAMLKSWAAPTLTVTVVERDSGPTEPVTVTE